MITRRQFLATTGALAAAPAFSLRAQNSEPLRAVIIGHTGRGNYGHALDVALTDVPGVEVMGVADPEESGRRQAAQKAKAKKGYADWREMIAAEKPNLVCLASRWSEHRREMALAALQAGAHILSEKPFTQTLAEGDEILAFAEREQRRIAVAHQIRLSPATVRLKEAIDGGLIGELVQIQSWGKQDSRAGGEDMLVLGSHLFDLIRFFAGDPEWCTARVVQNNEEITRKSGRPATEGIGLVAGNKIFAQFGFPNGVMGGFTSTPDLRETLGPWSIRLIGSKGVVHFLVEIDPSIYLLEGGKWNADLRTDKWARWDQDPNRNLPAEERGFGPANRRVVEDLLAAIAENREPLCSGRRANAALEMIMAVYQSALARERVYFPLQEREHPLQQG